MSAELDLDDCAAQSAKAVEELAELRGEIARLDAERKQALSVVDQQALDLLDRAAEIERLREALLRISFLPQDDPAEWVEQAMEIVDAALAATEDDGACLVRHHPRVQRVA